LASSFDPAVREALLARLRFYRDLGLTEFYRRPVDEAMMAQFASAALSSSDPRATRDQPAQEQAFAPAPTPAAATILQRADPQSSSPSDETYDTDQTQASLEGAAIPPRKPITTPPASSAEAVPAAQRAAFLQLIREDIGDCTRCALHQGRNKIVFGDGSPNARLMFVGEGPGADEDAQGIPFVGKAGQLLNNMIAAMGLKREEVYIANVVKCRPPGNRTPEPDEGNTCSPFLFRQIDVIRPQVLVALGATAATYLFGSRQPLAGLRGRVHAFRGSQLIVTYHPAYLLRDPRQKKEAWADLQVAMRELGLKAPARG
jgi:uracil-DNA glycosylase family 4